MENPNQSISYSAAKSKLEKARENKLLNDLKCYRDKSSQIYNFNDPTILAKLNSTECDYEECMENQSCSKISNSNLISKLDGEKPTRYFCNLEKKSQCSKIYF